MIMTVSTTIINGTNGHTNGVNGTSTTTTKPSFKPSPAYEATIRSLIYVLHGLSSFLSNLPQPTENEQDIYTRPFPSLGATIGAHTRHILDRLQNVLNPVLNPELISADHISSSPMIPIDYANRNRNSAEQSSRAAALTALSDIESQLSFLLLPEAPSPNTFLASRDEHPDSAMITTLWNELSQGKSHTVHHCAYLRVVVESEFGIWDEVSHGMGAFKERFGLDSATPASVINGKA